MKLPKYSNRVIGADPEFGLTKYDGTPYPVVGLLGGTKRRPIQIKEIHPMCAYQEDNVFPEFNIPPCSTVEDFVYYNQVMVQQIMERIPPEYELIPSFLPSHRFDPIFLTTKQALVFGCEPDHNAYTLKIQKVEAGDAGNLRTAGGHLHLGWDESMGDVRAAGAVARAFDMFVTAPFMLIEPDNERRQLYGRAGSMRVKWYGVECRQLSCYWLSGEAIMRWVWAQTHKAWDFCEQNEEIHNPNSELCTHVRNLIDNKDLDGIRKLILDYDLVSGQGVLTK